MLFLVTALICAVSVAPRDCDRVTAAAVIALPGQACSINPQATVAGTAIKPGDGFYLKTVCEGR